MASDLIKAMFGKTDKPTAETTGEVTGEVRRLLDILQQKPLGRTEMQVLLGLKSQANFRDRYLLPVLKAGYIERTIPAKPNSRLQKYRLTQKGRQVMLSHKA